MNKYTIKGVDGYEPVTKCCKMVVHGEDVSDEYHSMSELYDHRMALNLLLFYNEYRNDIVHRGLLKANDEPRIMKAQLHHDGTMFEGYFIVMMLTRLGQISYHYKMEHWAKFRIPAVARTPEWDGHTGQDSINRLVELACIPLSS